MVEALGSLDSLKGVQLHLTLDNTGVGLAACDASGRLTLISPMLQDLFGIKFEAMTEPLYFERFEITFPDTGRRIPLDDLPLHRARGGEFVRDQVVSVRVAGGSQHHLRCNAAPMFDEEGGSCTGAVALIQDVTVEVEATRRAEAMRKRLVETINHEFRTPLAALLGHVELINDHRDRLQEQDPELAKWLAAIERSGWKLRDLVREVAELVTREEGDNRPVDCRPQRSIRSAS